MPNIVSSLVASRPDISIPPCPHPTGWKRMFGPTYVTVPAYQVYVSSLIHLLAPWTIGGRYLSPLNPTVYLCHTLTATKNPSHPYRDFVCCDVCEEIRWNLLSKTLSSSISMILSFNHRLLTFVLATTTRVSFLLSFLFCHRDLIQTRSWTFWPMK